MTEDIRRHLSDAQLDGIVFENRTLLDTEQAHLAACTACQERYQKALLLRNELAIARRSEPAGETLARYAQLFSEVRRRSLGERIADALERVRLTLSLDSRQTAQTMGLRHGFSFGRRLLFSADDVDVELLLEPVGNHWNLQGDILPFTSASMAGPYLIQLTRQAPPETDRLDVQEYLTESASSGRFRLNKVPTGRYALLVTPAAGPMIEIPALDIS